MVTSLPGAQLQHLLDLLQDQTAARLIKLYECTSNRRATKNSHPKRFRVVEMAGIRVRTASTLFTRQASLLQLKNDVVLTAWKRPVGATSTSQVRGVDPPNNMALPPWTSSPQHRRRPPHSTGGAHLTAQATPSSHSLEAPCGYHSQMPGLTYLVICLTERKFSRPQSPSSRPWPLFLIPPQGAGPRGGGGR